MTYPATMALRGGDWAAAARRGGADVTEILLSDELGSPAVPTIAWLAQPALRRYVIELPAARKPRKRDRILAERVGETMKVIANHHGAVDILHTHDARFAAFAEEIVVATGVRHVHSPADDDQGNDRAEVYEHADLIRTTATDAQAAGLADAHRDRLHVIPTPIDFSIEGAEPQLVPLDRDESPLTTPGEPWLAAIRPRKIVWRGDLAGSAARRMIDAFVALQFIGTQLELIGRDDVAHHIEEAAQRLGLEGRIVVRSAGTPREMAAVIAEADLLVIGDDDPILQREVMTAALLGTPVIAPATPIYREVVTPQLGAVVDDSADSLAAAIRSTTVVDAHEPVTMKAAASRHTLAAVGRVLADMYSLLAYGEAAPAPKLRSIGTDDGQLAI